MEAVIGKELLNKAILAIVLSCVGIVAYVSLRFEFKFGVAAVLALIHDTILVLGVFALLGRQVNSPFIAAILTIIGYSINAVSYTHLDVYKRQPSLRDTTLKTTS